MATDEGLVAATPEVFGQYPVGSWSVAGAAPVSFPVLDVKETGGNRLVQHERPFRDGAKLDDTGATARTFTLTCLFDNSIEEPDIPADPPLYPTVLNLLLESFGKHETGDLVVPTRGKIRARAQTYTRAESHAARDSATLDLVFIEDNEDSVDARSLGEPTVRASALRLSEHCTYSAQSEGMDDENLNSLTDTLSEVQGLLAAPGENVETIEAQTRRNRRAIEATVEAGETLGRQVGGLFNEPRGASSTRQLRRLADQQAKAADEKSRGRPRLVPYTVRSEVSIFAVAVLVRQPAERLMDINAGRLADPLRIPAGTTIRVYERAP
jgi:prophage DNA circulation protein